MFRAVSIDEAVNTLQTEYVERAESLRDALNGLEPADDVDTTEATHEVWALSGDQGITSRTRQLIEGATDELILVIGHESIFTDQLAEQLRTAKNGASTLSLGWLIRRSRPRFRTRFRVCKCSYRGGFV